MNNIFSSHFVGIILANAIILIGSRLISVCLLVLGGVALIRAIFQFKRGVMPYSFHYLNGLRLILRLCLSCKRVLS